jgi:hypothetical protein
MNTTRSELQRELAQVSKYVPKFRAMVDKRGGKDIIGAPLLLAMASRETNMRNIAGDGGHGRGMFQQDDRYLADWLHRRAGCKSGTDTPVKGKTALMPGYVPTVEEGAKKCVDIVVGNYHAAQHAGYAHNMARRIAIAGYNGGLTGAMNAARYHHDPDHATTGGDYSADCLERAGVLYQLMK